jgi:glutaredoxin 3
MKKIIIYTTDTCPYCVRAKSLLKKKNASYEEVNVSNDEILRDAMIAKAGGRRTFRKFL